MTRALVLTTPPELPSSDPVHLVLVIPKNWKTRIEAFAAKEGVSLETFIALAVERRLDGYIEAVQTRDRDFVLPKRYRATLKVTLSAETEQRAIAAASLEGVSFSGYIVRAIACRCE